MKPVASSMDFNSNLGTSKIEVPSKTNLKIGHGKANFSLTEFKPFTAVTIT
jgi:hypothetical protein